MSTDPGATAEHLRMLVDAARGALLRLLEESSVGGVRRMVEAHPFLLDHVAAVAGLVDDGDDWDVVQQRLLERVRAFEGGHPGLALLRADVTPDLHDRLVLAMAGLVADDLRFAAVARSLQVPLDTPAFAPQTIAAALDPPGSRATHRVVEGLLERRLLWAPAGSPRAGVEVDPAFWHLARDPDHPGWRPPPVDRQALDHWRPRRRQDLLDAVRGLVGGTADTLVVRAVPGADAPTVLAAALDAAGTWAVPTEADALAERSVAAGAAVRGAVPLVAVDVRPGEEAPSPRPGWYRGPLAVLLGRSGGIRPDGDRRLHVSLDRGDPDERSAFWASVRPRPGGSPERLAAAFVLPDGYLRHIARDAAARARVGGRRRPRLEDLRAAAEAVGRHALENRAVPVPTEGLSWNDLVVPGTTATALRLLERRCHLRERVAAGQRSRGSSGVRALLLGPSGVGKTLAASVLAGQLGRRAYRVDLAAVFDKYVGETEKHLDAVLAAAEQLDCVLVIDEGDTLLGERTSGAHDRYANLETNFLLQRLEDYTGVVVVTSNAGDRIDPGFARRMETTIAFPRPRADERAAIWRLKLPAGHLVDDALVYELAARHRLTGGQIRNAALHATMLALDADRPVGPDDVLAAVEAEHRKSGRLPPGSGELPRDGIARRDAFLGRQRALAARRGGRDD